MNHEVTERDRLIAKLKAELERFYGHLDARRVIELKDEFGDGWLVQAIREGVVGYPAKTSGLRDLFDTHVQGALDEYGDQKSAPLEPTQSVAIATERPKLAAVLYDRVWGDAPDGIQYFNAGESEIHFLATAKLLGSIETTDPSDSRRAEFSRLLLYAEHDNVPALNVIFGALTGLPGRSVYERMAAEFAPSTNTTVGVFHDSPSARAAEYTEGDRRVLFAALADVGLIDEEATEWDAIVQLREDKESRTHFRNMMHWLDSTMINKSKNWIADEIALRIERYQNSLRKHGIRTAVGTMETLIDGKTLLPLLGLSTGAHLLQSPELAALAAVTAIGKVGLKLSQELLKLDDDRIKHQSEIGYLIKLGKLEKSQRRPGEKSPEQSVAPESPTTRVSDGQSNPATG